VVNEDRAHAILVVGLLTVDAALLALMELMFLTLSVGVVPLPVSALVALVSTPWLVRRAGELGGGWSAAAPLIALKRPRPGVRLREAKLKFTWPVRCRRRRRF